MKQVFDVNMCGFYSEGKDHQFTFLMSEAAKHDSNSIASMLYYYIEYVNPDVKEVIDLHLHMDSCYGQNKNNVMLGYCILRVLQGMHNMIILNYMTVGHTKFAPDRCLDIKEMQ